MTEFEVREVLFNIFDTMSDNAAMYFTLVSAYLATSYVVGRNLSTKQLTIINVLYVVWVLGSINAMYSMLIASNDMYDQLRALGIGTQLRPEQSNMALGGFIFVQVGGLLASLYFMWTVRHPQTE